MRSIDHMHESTNVLVLPQPPGPHITFEKY